MPTGTVPSGQSVDVVLGTNTGKLRTVVTLSGRSSRSFVKILCKEAGSSEFALPAGVSEINTADKKTLVLTGASIDQVRIDDTYNRGLENMSFFVDQYPL